MDHFPIVLAHGALGPYDELIIPVIGGAFIGLIVITWWTSRNRSEDTAAAPPSESAAQPTKSDPSDDPTHYRLD